MSRLICFLVMFISGSSLVAQADALTAQQILENNYLANRLPDTKAEIRMTLRNSEGKERVRQLSVFSKLQNRNTDAMYVLFFRSPADIKGTATLLIQRTGDEDDMWVYLPALRKTRRLFSDNKRDSFMGSDLSYGDIIGQRPAEWVSSLLREDQWNGIPVYVLEAIPATPEIQASSGYSKRTLMISKNNFIAMHAEYLDETGRPLKSVSVSDVKSLGNTGKFQFMLLEADQLQTGNHTTLRYEIFTFNNGLTEDSFTQRSLERGIE